MEKSENYIQQEIVMFFNNTYCLKHHRPRRIIFAVPNGGKRDVREAMTLRNTGVLSGVSDLILVGICKVIYCEVKTLTGRQSDEQKEFEERIKDLGFIYILVRSLEEFKVKVTELLQNNLL